MISGMTIIIYDSGDDNTSDYVGNDGDHDEDHDDDGSDYGDDVNQIFYFVPILTHIN